ncbi:MAG: hypothetical protein ACLFMO_07370 [Eubacteriales bacterium]
MKKLIIFIGIILILMLIRNHTYVFETINFQLGLGEEPLKKNDILNHLKKRLRNDLNIYPYKMTILNKKDIGGKRFVVYEFTYDNITSWGYASFEKIKDNCYYFYSNIAHRNKEGYRTAEIEYEYKGETYKVKVTMYGDINLLETK